jgi:hypothetical protein
VLLLLLLLPQLLLVLLLPKLLRLLLLLLLLELLLLLVMVLLALLRAFKFSQSAHHLLNFPSRFVHRKERKATEPEALGLAVVHVKQIQCQLGAAPRFNTIGVTRWCCRHGVHLRPRAVVPSIAEPMARHMINKAEELG